jgi:hypothetical protein
MTGAILQLQSTGIQDLYLTHKPDINVFQYGYYRYVNFATETLNIPLNQSAQFGTKVTVDIPKKGHLLSKMYLKLSLPQLTKNQGSYACWADTLGYCIFSQPVELSIGGVVVDKLYPVCMDLLNELSVTSKKEGLDQMILKSDVYRSAIHNADYATDLIIPLEFWFTKAYSMALPLLSMQGQDISLNFYFRDFPDVINYDGITGPDPVYIMDSCLYVEYIFLDEVILNSFQKQKHQYVIPQMVYHGDEYILPNQTLFTTKINFQYPCKELLFVCIDENNLENNNYFNYSRRSDGAPLVLQATLTLDGRHRFNNDFLPEYMFREYFPNNVHSVIPTKHMYVMPFSMKPEDATQPTGSINLSRFDEVDLILKMNRNNPSCQIHIYAIIYNVVTIENGSLTFEWLTQ